MLKNIIKNKIKWIILYIKSKSNKNVIFLVNTPEHGNLGDQALVIAEYNMFSELLYDYKIIELSRRMIEEFTAKQIKILIGKRKIYVQAGGFLGTLWLSEEYAVRKVLKCMKNNEIVILPQTITFSKDDSGEYEKQKSKQIYNACRNIKLCVRNKSSVGIAEELVGKENVLLVPDMVISYYSGFVNNSVKENKCIFCMRKDKEKRITDELIGEMQGIVRKELAGITIEWSDTVKNRCIKKNERRDSVNSLLIEYSKAKLIITDRLHGMLFAAIIGVPCIAFNNTNGKVKEVFKWIEELEYIEVVNNITELETAVNKVVNCKQLKYPNKEMKEKSIMLQQLIINSDEA